MVDNSTWAGMKAMQLRYVVSCSPCNRMVEMDLDKMPPDGNAIRQRFRCSQCGRYDESIVTHRSADKAYPAPDGRSRSPYRLGGAVRELELRLNFLLASLAPADPRVWFCPLVTPASFYCCDAWDAESFLASSVALTTKASSLRGVLSKLELRTHGAQIVDTRWAQTAAPSVVQ